jgi:8-oxo-dGTP diphosphatase
MARTEPETAAADHGCAAADAGWHGEVLTTARLRLRRLEPADAADIARQAGEWEVARHTARIPHPYDQAEARRFIDRAARDAADGAAYVMGVERTVDGALIGCVAFAPRDGRAELGTWIGREHWGQGYATEALRRVLRLVFQNFPAVAEARAAVHPENAASARVMEKAGMSFQGIGNLEMPARGAAIAGRVFAVAREEWAARHAAGPMVLVVAAALVDADGRVLMARRPPGKMMAGLWEFPGGKVHDGETPEAALIRELREELGIDVTRSCLAPLAFASHDYDTFRLLMPLYVCRTWKGEVTAREGQALTWLRPNRLRDLPMPPADVPLIAILREWV